MRSKLIVIVVFLMMFAVGVQADSHCSDEIGCVVLAPDDPVTIGVMSALSGPVAFLGEDSVGGVEIALNRRGRMVLDREIELVTEDSLCSAEGGQTAAQKIASDEQILGVVGTSCSGAAVSALPVISGGRHVDDFAIQHVASPHQSGCGGRWSVATWLLPHGPQ